MLIQDSLKKRVNSVAKDTYQILKTRGLPSASFFAAYVGESIVTESLLKTLSTTFRCRSITFQDAPGDGRGWN